MVESGQAPDRADVALLGFSNPDRPPLGLEVVSYARLNRRISTRLLASVHRTDFHQIFLITGGSGIAMVDFTNYPCRPGAVLNIAPGRVLRLPRPATPEDRLDALMVLFAPAFPPPLEHARMPLDPFGPVLVPVPPADRRALTRTAHDLHADYRRTLTAPSPAPVTVEILRHQLSTLLLRIARLAAEDSALPGADSAQRETFRRFRHELERSFAATRNAADYAARLGYSPRTLNRACQSAAGLSAKALIDARVALEAKRLLAHTSLPVAAIARRLGFSEPANFGKFFTRQTGSTPGAFRTREHT